MKHKLRDVCSITKGATGIMKAVPGQYPLVALSEERRSHNEYQFDAKAVIVPLISSTGHGHASLKRVHYQEGKFALGNILCAVIPKDSKQLHARYLHIFLQQNKDSLLVPLMKGAANVSLPISRLGEVEIDVPTLQKQVEIIELHDTISEIDASLSVRLISQENTLTELWHTILREAMQGKLVPQDPNDEPASELLKRIRAEKANLVKKKKIKPGKELPPIKPEEIPYPIPDNWVWCRFADVVDIKTNLVSPYNYPSHPHISPENIEKNTGRLLPYNTVLQDDVNSANQYFYPGQLLYSKVRPKLNKVVSVDFEGLCSADMYPLETYMNIEYIKYCMLSGFFLAEVDRYDNRVKMPKINQTQLSLIPIPIPPLPEQQRMVEKINTIDRLYYELINSIESSNNLKGLMFIAFLRESLK